MPWSTVCSAFSWLHLRAVPFRAPQLPCCESQPGEHTYIWMCLFVIIHTLVSKIWWSFLKSLSWILLCLIILAYIDRWFHRNTFRSCIASGHACWLLTFVLRIKRNSLFREWKLFWVSLLTDAPEFYYFCHPTHSPNLITNSFLIHVSYLLVLYILTGWKGFYWDPLAAVWLLGHGTVLHCREFWVFVVHLLL